MTHDHTTKAAKRTPILILMLIILAEVFHHAKAQIRIKGKNAILHFALQWTSPHVLHL